MIKITDRRGGTAVQIRTLKEKTPYLIGDKLYIMGTRDTTDKDRFLCWSFNASRMASVHEDAWATPVSLEINITSGG